MLLKVYCLLWIFPIHCFCRGTYNETRELHTALLKNYNTDLVPVLDEGRSLQVNVSAYIMALTGLDEKSQILTVTLFVYFKWTDEMLKWDDTKFSNIDRLLINADSVWVPEVYFVNSVKDMQLRKAGEDHFVRVQSNGVTVWFPAAELQTSCAVDLSDYPFDVQTCKIRIEAWYHDNNDFEMNVIDKGIHISSAHFVENGEWAIGDLTAIAYRYSDYDVNTSFYCGIEYTVKLKRRYSYHLLTTAFPFVTLIALNLLAMVIPTDSSEKLGFCMSLFLTMIVFLTLIAQNMPSSSFFISYLTFLVGLQILVSGLTISVVALCIYARHQNEAGDPPCWVQMLFAPLGTFLRVCGKVRHTDVGRKSGNGNQLSWSEIEHRLDIILKLILILSFIVTIVILVIVSQ